MANNPVPRGGIIDDSRSGKGPVPSEFSERYDLDSGCSVESTLPPHLAVVLAADTRSATVYLWLSLISPSLPQLVKQKYGAELRNRSLASLKPEILQALSSLQDELRTIEDTRTMRIASGFNSRRSTPGRDMIRKAFVAKSCVLCKTVG